MQNFGQNPNSFMGQPNPYMGQMPNPYMGQYADPNMGQMPNPFMGQPNPFMDPNADPSMAQGQEGADMQQGFPSYGHQWAQYEDQAAQYTAETQAAQQAAEAAQQAAADGQQAGDTAQQSDTAGGTTDEYVDPYAVDEGDIGMAMPMYGYDASYMPEFGASPIDPYGYGYVDPYAAMQQPLIDGNQPVVEQRWRAHPVLVFSLMLICFPIGLALMLFFTDWGVFAKSYTTLFVLAMALTVYEILVYKQVIAAPSIVKMVMDMLA